MSITNPSSLSLVEHFRPCESTPEGALFPGRPGETLAEFIARRLAESAGLDDAMPIYRPWARFGYWEMGR